jgi:peroxiredoxin
LARERGYGRGGAGRLQATVSVIQLVLAAVFVVAGLAKARDRAGTRAAVERFGVPQALAGTTALALPVVELAIAIALFPAATARFAAAAALVLLVAFSIAIARLLIRGEAVACRCFGSLSEAPMSGWTLARNAVLAVLAAVATFGPTAGALAWLDEIAPHDRPAAIAIIVLALAVLALGAFCLQLLRDNGRLLLALDDAPEPQPGLLPAGAPMPAFTRTDLHGRTVASSALVATEHPLLLLFSDAGCSACHAALERAADVEQGAAVTVAVIIRGDEDRARDLVTALGLTTVVHDHDDTLFAAFGFGGAPAALLAGSDGRLIEPATIGGDGVLALIDSTSAPVLDIHLVGA